MSTPSMMLHVALLIWSHRVPSGEKEGNCIYQIKMLEKLWDDVVAGPQPERGLGKLRRTSAKPLNVGQGDEKKFEKSLSMPASPSTPGTPSFLPKENVWRSVFHPGSNLATRSGTHEMYDKPQPNSPTVYDWLYSGETRSKHHH
ncbi:Auxin-repressed 12.5 kDa protein [Linum perenne]